MRKTNIFKRMVSGVISCAMLFSVSPIVAMAEDGDVNIRYFESIGKIEVLGNVDSNLEGVPVTIKILDENGEPIHLMQMYSDEDGVINAHFNLINPISFEELKEEYETGINIDGIYYPVTVLGGKYLSVDKCEWDVDDRSITISGRYHYDELGENASLILEVQNNLEEVVYSCDINADRNYDYKKEFVPSQHNIPSGELKIIVKNQNGYEEYISFNYKDPQVIFDALEGTRTVENYKEILKDEDNLKVIGLDEWENAEGVKFVDFSDEIFAIMAQSPAEYNSVEVIKHEANGASITEAINSADDIDDVEEILFIDYKDFFTVTECSAINQYNELGEEKDTILEEILDEDFTTYNDFENKFAEDSILAAINTSETASQLKEIADGNTKYINISSPLTLTEWSKILKKLPYSDIETLEGDCEDIIDARKPGGSGGPGGSGNDKPDSSFEVKDVHEQVTEKPAFSDLGSAVWAKEAITNLSERGIVSGIGDNKFNPGGIVKREELITMLVRALGVSADGQKAEFDDVDVNAWYYPYIAVAYNLGITAGKGDGNFGVGEGLTRQDAAVMCYRSFEKLSNAEVEQKDPFKDDASISDYAKTAVNTLYGLGIINGIGDGRFAPQEVCTRAQMAQMLYSILLYVEE